jgi:predicted dinucleotide-utilizing enzyme
MFGFATEAISKVRVGIIGLGNRGNTLLEMFQYLVENEMAEVISLSDISEEKVTKAAEKLAVWQSKKTSPLPQIKNRMGEISQKG